MSIPDWMIDTPSASADDLAALVTRLARSLRKAAPDNDLPGKAMDYLAKHGIAPSPLREVQPSQTEVQAEPVAWMYSFTHSSAIWHGDHDIGPVVTKDRKAAFGVGCFDQQPLFTSPQATQQDAIDAAKWRFVQASPDHAVCAMDHGHGWYAVTDAAIQAAQQGVAK